MKLLTVALAASLAFTSLSASADFDHHHHHHDHHHGGGYNDPQCSPAMQENTATVIQKTLADAAASKDFESASTFQDFVSKTGHLTSADARLHAYLGAVGVDADDAQAVAQFIGARDRSVYVASAEKNLGLTPAQADLLIQRITSAAMTLINPAR